MAGAGNLKGKNPKQIYKLFVDALEKKDKDLLKELILPSAISEKLTDKGFEKTLEGDSAFRLLSSKYPTEKLKYGRTKQDKDSATLKLKGKSPGVLSVSHSGGHAYKLQAEGTVFFKKVDGVWKISGREISDKLKRK
jgi:hypothetical protein